MSEGWKQIWKDMRSALRAADAVDVSGTAVESLGDETAAARSVEDNQIALEPSLELSLPSEVVGDEEEASVPEDTGALASPAPLPVTHPPSGDGLGRWIPLVLAGSLALLVLFSLRDWFSVNQLDPPAPGVVATYDGGQITLDDVTQHLALLAPDEAIQLQFQSVESYRLLVDEMISDELVRRWAAERKAGRDENLQHVMEHITENINLDELHTQMHQGQMGVTEEEIQIYYDANRQQFGDQTLTQTRDQIRTTLQARQEDQFVQDYINSLKENATITRDFALLDTPEAEEREINAYYAANRERYVIPAQAVLDEIRIPVGEDEAAAQEKANKALVRLRSGEDFAVVAGEFSVAPFAEQGSTVRKGDREPAYDAVVFALDPEEISEVFRAGDALYVVGLRSIAPERQQSLDEVREQARQAVLAEKETAWFQENADRTLFTIHGERYTVGEFRQEYQELPPDFLASYQGAEGRQALAERLIERLLLVEDSYDQLLDVKNKDEIEEMRLGVLAQMMEQEEVDDKIEVTDEELQAYYDANKPNLMQPPQARIRYIQIRLGQTEDEYKRAWEKANQAHEKLVPGLFKKGTDFAEVAREYSEDEMTASKGGELEGWIGEGPDILTELSEHPLHQRALSLREGEISSPFEWNSAIYIVQVLERKDPQPLIFEEIKEPLREELRLRKHDELSAQLSQRLLKQANVIFYDQTLQLLLDEQSQATRSP